MGSRSRRNPAEHIPRSKGAPTSSPPAPVEPHPAGVPASVVVVFAEEFRCRAGVHPAIAGPLLDLGFRFPGGSLTVRMPLEAGPLIHAELGALLEHAAAGSTQTRSGIHLPGSDTNVAAEAAAINAITKGPNPR